MYAVHLLRVYDFRIHGLYLYKNIDSENHNEI